MLSGRSPYGQVGRRSPRGICIANSELWPSIAVSFRRWPMSLAKWPIFSQQGQAFSQHLPVGLLNSFPGKECKKMEPPRESRYERLP